MLPFESARALGLATLLSLAAGCSGAGPIDREIAASGPGVVTVVEFVDYDCRFCREQHERLRPMLERRARRRLSRPRRHRRRR